MRNFKERWEEHIQKSQEEQKELYLYNLLENEDEWHFEVLIDCGIALSSKTLQRADVEAMELGLITMFKPKGNLAGRTTEFKFNGER